MAWRDVQLKGHKVKRPETDFVWWSRYREGYGSVRHETDRATWHQELTTIQHHNWIL